MAAHRVLTAGFFDGVHRGHAALLRGADVAITFSRHPAETLAPARAPKLLMPAQSRIEAVRAIARETIVLEWNAALADTSAADFAAMMRETGADTVRCGGNWRFGKGGEGDAAFLRKLGFRVEVAPYAAAPGGERVSSTRIRAALAVGDLAGAEAMLGRCWTLHGATARGKGRGASLGAPTVNLVPDAGLQTVPPGVYKVEVFPERRGGGACAAAVSASRGEPALANFGFAPTFGAQAWPEPVLEINFRDRPPDFAAGEGVRLEAAFTEFIRPEIKFADEDELRRRIAADRRIAWNAP